LTAKPPNSGSWIREWIETIVVALVLALLIRTFVIQAFYIPSGSMEPTLLVKDRLIVNKFLYKFRDPKRFDIVVFKYPYSREGEPRKDYIKRIIGLPGETVEVKDGVVHIDGRRLSEDHAMNRDSGDFGPYVMPDDGYFMMGDNRPNSSDARYWRVHNLPRKFMIGPALFRFWPLNRLGFLKH